MDNRILAYEDLLQIKADYNASPKNRHTHPDFGLRRRPGVFRQTALK